MLDFIVASAIEEPPRDDPPPTPAAGSCYIVGDNPSGDWTAYAGHLAGWTGGGWRFVAPTIGIAARDKSSGKTAVYTSTGWSIGTVEASRLLVDGHQVIGSRQGFIADPVGGTTVDTEARSAIAAVLTALRQHGLIAS